MIDLPHFEGGDPKNGAYDPEIQTRSRFMYNAPTHQVSSSISKVNVLSNKQTKRSKTFTLLCYAGVEILWSIIYSKYSATQVS